MDKQSSYPEKKKRDLTEHEKQAIREEIEKGNSDIYQLAEKFNCSTSQVAGIKASLSR